MDDQRLARQLLGGGVGLRHVRRTLRELGDHRADLVERLVEQGQERTAATREAHQLLGDRRELVAQMIARPELRSRARRFAWLLFVLGPVPMVFVVATLVMFAVGAILYFSGVDPSGRVPDNTEIFIIRVALQWVAPGITGLLLCREAARRWVPAIWPVCAMVIVALLSGTTGYSVHVSPAQKVVTTIGMGLYPFDVQRAIMLFCVLGLAYVQFRRRSVAAAGVVQ